MKQVQLCSPQKKRTNYTIQTKVDELCDLALSSDNRKIVVRFFVNKAPGFTQNIDGHG